MKIYADSPQSIGAVIDAGIRLFKASFTALLPIVLMATVISSLPVVLMVVLLGTGIQPDPARFNQVMPIFGALIFVTTLLSMILYGAMVHRVNVIAQGRINKLSMSLKAGMRASLWLLLASILYILAVVVGSVLLLVPGMIVMVSGMFYIYATMIDGKKGLAALRFSHQMVWGNWWRTSTLLTVVMVMVMVFSMVVGFVLGFAAAFIPLLRTEMAGMFVQMLVNLLTMPVVMPLSIAVLAVCYQDLKLRKQGGDIKARMAQGASRQGPNVIPGGQPAAHV